MKANLPANLSLGVIGAGQMAEALVAGILRAGLLDKRSLQAADPDAKRRKHFQDLFDITVTADNAAAVRAAKVVLLAVKPQTLPQAVSAMAGALDPAALVISVAAGITTARLEGLLPAGTRVVRAMPNLPAAVGMGMAAYCRGKRASGPDAELAGQLLAAAGAAVLVDESLMDAVTALSGSGPAYVFYLAECMIQAGQTLGFDETMARRLTLQTIRGAASLLADDGPSPREWRQRVTSPAGTTAAALAVLETSDLPLLWEKAIQAAAGRARELAE